MTIGISGCASLGIPVSGGTSVAVSRTALSSTVSDYGATTTRAPDLTWAIEISLNYSLLHDIKYSRANNFDLRLDILKPRDQSGHGPRPTLFYIHGGGWMELVSKDISTLTFLPFLQLGWTVVNVDYRPSSVSLAPAAVEDCFCALRWLGRNAKEYNVDTSLLVLMGHSAGGHLALTTGMIPLSTSGLSAPCDIGDMYDGTPGSPASSPLIKVAAIINWYGITDVGDLVEGPHERGYAVKWLGNQTDRLTLAKSVSPLTYVRSGSPPVITVHGANDVIVPYHQAVKLHDALTAAKVPNKLVTVAQAGHGDFSVEVIRDTYAQLFDFLEQVGIVTGARSTVE